PMPGRFVVIEGIDGAGTTTQVARLVDRLRKSKIDARSTREPSDGPVGTLIRQVLSGRVVVPGGRAPGWATMSLLFAADRVDHVEAEIEPALAHGAVVVSDRYDASSLAYQSVTSGGGGQAAVDWIAQLNRQARRPDLTIVLDVPADVAAARREARGEPAQLYEHNEVQRQLAVFYKNLSSFLPNDRIVNVDATVSVEEVAERVFAAYSAGFSG
ncbi:MAG TPA: dTMP kinase, partial [Polyangiaceae bacterium]